MVKKSPHHGDSSTKTDLPGLVRLEPERVSILPDPKIPDPAFLPFIRDNFDQDVSVKVVKLGKNFIEFDLVGVAPSIANSLRRASIAEVPTMAIETVFVVNNTSVIPDEVLSHRLGLIPIYADPRKFDSCNGEATDMNTIVFELREKCLPIQGASADADPEVRYSNSSVFSKSIKWIPQGSQEELFSNNPIRICHNDILLVKLRPNQEIDMELHCIKGVGKDHAKWSPVSCSSYRLLPKITITSPITGQDAVKFANCFPPGVIIVEKKNGVDTAIVKDSRNDTVSRECLRHPEFADKVVLSRVHDHFIFHMESVGFYPPVDVVKESLKILSEKCARLKESLALI